MSFLGQNCPNLISWLFFVVIINHRCIVEENHVLANIVVFQNLISAIEF
jgi:hypothetical protein